MAKKNFSTQKMYDHLDHTIYNVPMHNNMSKKSSGAVLKILAAVILTGLAVAAAVIVLKNF